MGKQICYNWRWENKLKRKLDIDVEIDIKIYAGKKDTKWIEFMVDIIKHRYLLMKKSKSIKTDNANQNASRLFFVDYHGYILFKVIQNDRFDDIAIYY